MSTSCTRPWSNTNCPGIFTIAWHKSPGVTLEKYNRFVPNLTREDGKLLAGTSGMGKRFPTSVLVV